MNIEELRGKIDNIDNQLVELFIERMSVVKEVAVFKKENSIGVEQGSREEEILSRVTENTSQELQIYIKHLFNTLFETSKSYQKSFVEFSSVSEYNEKKDNTIKNKSCQLIGNKLSHSFSKDIHTSFGEYDYTVNEITLAEVKNTILNTKFDGINVTIPYKSEVIPYLDEIDPVAKAIGAINVIVVKNGKKIGYNTDVEGMIYMIKRENISLKNKKVLILGRGGTSKTANFVAQTSGAKEILFVSRQGDGMYPNDVNYENIYNHTDTEIIINTTPVGMYPNNYSSIIDISKFPKLVGLVDAIYNPLETQMTFEAKKKNIKCTLGISMLVAQAKYARDLFVGNVGDDDIIEKVIENLSKKVTNIILIGMPGSGKTVIGKQIAEKMNRKFFDVDEEIIKKHGKSIPEIFEKEGEEYFRKEEIQIMKDLGKERGIVISCGGGVVKKEQNDFSMKQNGYVVYIKREIENLSKKGRPLSSDMESLEKLFKERSPKYENLCNFEVENNLTIEKCVETIMEKYNNNLIV